MKIRIMTHEDERKWDDYVTSCTLSSAYHQTGWKRVIEKTFGHKTYYLLSEDKCLKVNGIFPLVQLKSFLFGNFLVSMPYFNYGGICASEAEVYNLLLEEAIHVARALNVDHIELREDRPVDVSLPCKSSKVGMRLELPAAADVLWKSFSSNLRNKVKRPQRDGMFAKIGRLEELNSFYDVFSKISWKSFQSRLGSVRSIRMLSR